MNAPSEGTLDVRVTQAGNDDADCLLLPSLCVLCSAEKRTESRRLTAMSDWGNLPASVKAQLDRKSSMWILEGQTPSIEDVYVIGAQIGQPGQFGRAHRCLHKATGAQRAVKVSSTETSVLTRHTEQRFFCVMMSTLSDLFD